MALGNLGTAPVLSHVLGEDPGIGMAGETVRGALEAVAVVPAEGGVDGWEALGGEVLK